MSWPGEVGVGEGGLGKRRGARAGPQGVWAGVSEEKALLLLCCLVADEQVEAGSSMAGGRRGALVYGDTYRDHAGISGPYCQWQPGCGGGAQLGWSGAHLVDCHGGAAGDAGLEAEGGRRGRGPCGRGRRHWRAAGRGAEWRGRAGRGAGVRWAAVAVAMMIGAWARRRRERGSAGQRAPGRAGFGLGTSAGASWWDRRVRRGRGSTGPTPAVSHAGPEGVAPPMGAAGWGVGHPRRGQASEARPPRPGFRGRASEVGPEAAPRGRVRSRGVVPAGAGCPEAGFLGPGVRGLGVRGAPGGVRAGSPGREPEAGEPGAREALPGGPVLFPPAGGPVPPSGGP